MLALQGCTIHKVGPAYVAPEPEMPESFRYADWGPETDSERNEWNWSAYQDPHLQGMLDTLTVRNHSLKAALKRLQQARSLVGIAKSDGLPNVALDSAWNRSRSSNAVEVLPGVTNGRVTDLYDLSGSVSWEIDLFGRIESGREAAYADAQAVEADAEALLLAIESEVASVYFGLRTLELEIEVVQQGIRLREESAALIRDRVELGAATALDQAQADNQLAQSQADLAGLLLARSQAETALAVLVGESATEFQVEPGTLPDTTPLIPAGMPSELLQRRPDIRRAERRLAAENARIGVAEAAFYPSFTLTGEGGWQSSESGDLISQAGRIWGIRPSLYLPLFQGGRNRSNLQLAQASYEEVVEQYQNTVLEAIAEVESSLAGARYLEQQAEAQGRAVEAARTARRVARTRFDVGTVDYLNVIESERTALDSERAQVRLLGDRLQNSVQLFRSLGGPR